MGPNLDLLEQVLEMHRQDLRHEVEVRRLQARLGKPGLNRRLAGKLGVLLLKLGARLKQMEQPEIPL